MRDSEPLAAPPGAGAVYLVLVSLGIVVGFLCGAERIHPVALFVYGAGGIAVFIGWSVWRLDPAFLLQSEHYRAEPPEPESE